MREVLRPSYHTAMLANILFVTSVRPFMLMGFWCWCPISWAGPQTTPPALLSFVISAPMMLGSVL